MKLRYALIIVLLMMISIKVDAMTCFYTDGNIEIKLEYPGNDSVSYSMNWNYNNGKNFTYRNDILQYGGDFELDPYPTKCPETAYVTYCYNPQSYVVSDISISSDINDAKLNRTLDDAYGNTSTCFDHVSFTKNSERTTGESKYNPNTFIGGMCISLGSFQTFFDNNINKPLKILSVILFIVLTTIEYVKAIFMQEVEVKKANNRTVKRFIALLIVFFAQEIINLITLIAGMSVCK